jgi:excisionase family DNA binding protein
VVISDQCAAQSRHIFTVLSHASSSGIHSRNHVTAFRLISPHAALQILETADVRVDHRLFLANLAMAGVVRGHARLTETEGAGAGIAEVRDGRISRAMWRRIIAEDRVAEVYDTAAVHFDGGGQADRVSIIGIRFDAATVVSAAAEHGVAPPPTVAGIGKAKPKPSPEPLVVEPAPLNSGEVPIAPIKPSRAVLDAGTIALSKNEAAEVLGVSLGTVNNLIKRGELKAKNSGRRVLVQADSIRAYMGIAA